MVQEEIDGYLRPMRAQDWDKGSLLSMRTMNFASSFPYGSITVPVDVIIGEDDTFLLKTARRVCSSALHFSGELCAAANLTDVLLDPRITPGLVCTNQ